MRQGIILESFREIKSKKWKIVHRETDFTPPNVQNQVTMAG